MPQSSSTTCPQCAYNLTELLRVSPQLAFCPQCRCPLMVLAGKYQIVKEIAQGGFGMLFLVRHRELSRDAERVMKVIKPELVTHSSAVDRFKQEIRITASLSQHNDHIVRIYDDFGIEQGLGFFYIMEYLRGKPLSDYMGHGQPFSQRIALHLFEQLCNGMTAAHRAGVVHRDLKPANLFVVKRGHDDYFLKVIDFGIAKPLDWTPQSTMTRGLLGTPRYMAPEQCASQPVSARTDVYSMGAILYEMLTGVPLFPPSPEGGQSALVALMHAHLYQEPRPMRERRPDLDIPAALDEAVLIALRKQPESRFATAEEFWGAIAGRQQHVTAFSLTSPAMEGVSSMEFGSSLPPTHSQMPTPASSSSSWEPTSVESPWSATMDQPPPPPSVAVPSGSLQGVTTVEGTAQSVHSMPTRDVWDERPYSPRTRSQRSLGPWIAALSVVLGGLLLLVWQPWKPSKVSSSQPISRVPSRPSQESADGRAKPRKQETLKPPVSRKVQTVLLRERPPQRRRLRRRRRRRRRRYDQAYVPPRRTNPPVRARVESRLPVQPKGLCSQEGSGFWWVEARFRLPSRPSSSLDCEGGGVVRKKERQYCIGIPQRRRTIHCTVAAENYQPCRFALSRKRSIFWRLKRLDPNGMQEFNYACVTSR
ncbi:MAG: serine/threonine protein kinase [Deltaproteobacteria bacterium]|nr:MAG: serine/threonine protein kinase [Deltaproteobacteria bacterium]